MKPETPEAVSAPAVCLSEHLEERAALDLHGKKKDAQKAE
jgi:hypothetical protein